MTKVAPPNTEFERRLPLELRRRFRKFIKQIRKLEKKHEAQERSRTEECTSSESSDAALQGDKHQG
jgi:hypothetical protein